MYTDRSSTDSFTCHGLLGPDSQYISYEVISLKLKSIILLHNLRYNAHSFIQKRVSSVANTLELCLFWIKPLACLCFKKKKKSARQGLTFVFQICQTSIHDLKEWLLHITSDKLHAEVGQKTLTRTFKHHCGNIVSRRWMHSRPLCRTSSPNIPASVQIMAWCQPGDKPLSAPMMVSLRD